MTKKQSISGTDLENRNRRFAWIVLGIAVTAYVGLTFGIPLDPEDNIYNLSTPVIRMLQATIVIPVALIWAAAWFGSLRVRWYSSSITSEKESIAWHFVANGLLLITVALVAGSFLGLAESADLLSTKQRVISSNFVSTWLALFAYGFMAIGTGLLVKSQEAQKRAKQVLAKVIAVMLLLSTLYVVAVYSNNIRTTVPLGSDQTPTYFLNDVQIFILAVVPTILGWLFGSIAATQLLVFSDMVKGVLYKKALRYIVFGLTSVIIFAIVLQLVTQLGVFIGLNLAGILIAIYLILIFFALGYVLIASGAKRLLKIEQV